MFLALQIQPSLGGCSGREDFEYSTPQCAARDDVGRWEVDLGQQFQREADFPSLTRCDKERRSLRCLWPLNGAFKHSSLYKANVIGEAPRFGCALVKRPVWPSLGVLTALGMSVQPHAWMPWHI